MSTVEAKVATVSRDPPKARDLVAQLQLQGDEYMLKIEEEKQKMASIAGQAIEDGAVGFSTSRFLGHYIPDGRHVPGTHAEHSELVEIAKEVGARGALMQNVTNLYKSVEIDAHWT